MKKCVSILVGVLAVIAAAAAVLVALDMTVQGASAPLVSKMAMADESGALATLNMTVKSSGNQASAKGSVQVRNLCEVTFDLASTAQTTSENVKTAPAAGANIVNLGAETLPIAG